MRDPMPWLLPIHMKSLFICIGSNHGIGSRMSICPGVMGAGGTLKSLFICIGSNHGIGSRMSICPGVMFEGGVMVWGAMSLGVPVDVVHCVTGLDDNLYTVMSVGISLDVTVSGVVE